MVSPTRRSRTSLVFRWAPQNQICQKRACFCKKSLKTTTAKKCMQSVNDDMDELMRRAAENYSLDTSGSNWAAVAKALQTPDQVTEKKDSKGRLLWLLLLLPLGLVCNYYMNSAKDEKKLGL